MPSFCVAGATSWGVTLAALLARDGFICAGCGDVLGAPFDGQRTHVDHIVPVSRGGGDDRANLQLLHAPCNIAKGARVPA